MPKLRAATAYYLYPRHKHFRKLLKRERSALYKKLPWSFGNGQRLPVTAPGATQHYPAAKKRITSP